MDTQTIISGINALKQSDYDKIKKYFARKAASTGAGKVALGYMSLFKTRAPTYNCEKPLVTVTGLQRSGTHLLNHLLCDHPRILTAYSELHLGYPNKWDFPDLTSITGPRSRMKALFPQNIEEKFLPEQPFCSDTYSPLMFDYHRFKRIYLSIDDGTVNNPREILNAFFTAYFNAYINYPHHNRWIDYKYIVGSTPAVTRNYKSIDRFCQWYPDGHLLIMIRDPKRWWQSARDHGSEFPTKGIDIYEDSYKNILKATEEYPDIVKIVDFNNLVKETEASARCIADSIDIEFDEILTRPTNHPVSATRNSSFGHSEVSKVKSSPAERPIDLPDDELNEVETRLSTLYDKAKNESINKNL